MLIVNKFGKREAEGKGQVPVIAEALEMGLPVLIGVNGLNLAAFLAFAGEDVLALPSDPALIAQWCKTSAQVDVARACSPGADEPRTRELSLLC